MPNLEPLHTDFEYQRLELMIDPVTEVPAIQEEVLE